MVDCHAGPEVVWEISARRWKEVSRWGNLEASRGVLHVVEELTAYCEVVDSGDSYVVWYVMVYLS